MPVRFHFQKKTDRERFAGNDRIRVRKQLRFDQLAAFVGLSRGLRRDGKGHEEEKCPRKITPRDHPVTYHQHISAATFLGSQSALI
jgi:hypothetical protein